MSKKETQPRPSLVALLRGINVGGHTIKMNDLKQAFESLGCTNVKTVLASGNVLFDAPQQATDSLTHHLETGLKARFGYAIPTLLRTIAQLQELQASDPFKGIEVTADTRLYVTFLAEKPNGSLQIPYASADGSFRILRATDTEVCSLLILTEGRGTVDHMAFLEKEYSRNVTTRNWNTVLKILGQ